MVSGWKGDLRMPSGRGYVQSGSVLVISLLMLLAITGLGMSAMISSQSQERMAEQQRQSIVASLAAESGAAIAVRWLQMNPDAWGDEKAWKADGGLAFGFPSAPNLDSGMVYWIERVGFDGNNAVVVSRGGVWTAGEVLSQSAVMVTLKNEDESPVGDAEVVTESDSLVKGQEIKVKVVGWRPLVMTDR